MIETSKEQGERWGGGYTLTPPDRFNAPYVHHLKQEDLGRHTVQLGKGRVVTESLKKKKKSYFPVQRKRSWVTCVVRSTQRCACESVRAGLCCVWWSQRGHPRVALSHTLSSPSVVACRRLLVPGGAAVNQAQQAPLSRRKRPINNKNIPANRSNDISNYLYNKTGWRGNVWLL